MTAKSLAAAKQQRDMYLLEFKAACYDLEGELEPIGEKKLNARKIKLKMEAVKNTYQDCLKAQSQVYGMEKTSGAEEQNWSWVVSNLRKPHNTIIDKAEEVLYSIEVPPDPEAESKVKLSEKKKQAKIKLLNLEGKLKAELEAAQSVYMDTTIWLSSNHTALLEQVNGIGTDLNDKHIVYSNEYRGLLTDTEDATEDKRVTAYREELLPLFAKLQLGLKAKTPATGTLQSNTVAQQHQRVNRDGVSQVELMPSLPHSKTKFKMAAMGIPKFSGKVIDYPEWKNLFKDCVEAQYEESAVIMILRTQALPESLTTMVPRCTTLAAVWEKLDQKFLDPARVWKGIKADLLALDRKKLGDKEYMACLVGKILDAESLLDTVGLVHWLRQDDKIPEYEDLLTREEKYRWIEMKSNLTGTPWENFKSFLIKTRDIYEEIARSGTKSEVELPDQVKCTYCKKRNHTAEVCRLKKNSDSTEFKSKRECWKCGSEKHLAKECKAKLNQTGNKISSKGKGEEHESHSNYLRVKDCKWCNRTYNSAFTCAGCGKFWAAKTKSDHCLAHCIKFAGASGRERGEMVLKGGNCLICLHHEHDTSSCFGKDQMKTICGLGGCQKRHHPFLHSSPQNTIQSVQSLSNYSTEEMGEVSPGVLTGVSDRPEKFLAKIINKRTDAQKVSFVEALWSGCTKIKLEAKRATELDQMKDLLKLPVIDGGNVLLLIQEIAVKYGPTGSSCKITAFWDNGSTCSLVENNMAESLNCPWEPVVVSIDTVNGVITRNTKLYVIELVDNSGERVLIRAFGVESISEVKSLVDLTRVKNKFSDDVQSQWYKISKRPKGKVHLLIGEEYAGLHPIQFETRGNLVIYQSMFGHGWLISGCDSDLQAEECTWGEEVSVIRMGKVTVLQSSYRITVERHPVKLSFTQDRDFYTLENLGVEAPRRCEGCRNCRECSWRSQSLSKKEAFELEYIEKCVDFKDGRFHIQFPFLVDPHELADNFHQVVKIAEVEERRLLKEGRLDEFNELFLKLQKLGAVEEISSFELRSWSGPIHYVSLQHVIDESSNTTSFRIVSNSSLKTPGNPYSLNSILAKGPNLLTDPYKIMLRFRTYLKGLNSDVTKAYYQMFTGLTEKHVRRVVWRYGDRDADWKIFGYLCVSFGDTPAAALLEVCFRRVIEMYKHIDPLAAHRLLNDRFVDDITTGGSEEEVSRFKGSEDEETLACSGTMPQIFGKANLMLKAIAVSGENDGQALEKLSGTVLGHGYSTAKDILSVIFRVNITPRKRGSPIGPDLSRESISQIDSPEFQITRRIALGIVNGQFDMLGVTTPLLIKYKASMRDLFIKELDLNWDKPLSGPSKDIWISHIKELVSIGQFSYKRCVRPTGNVAAFWLIVFFDGSEQAYATAVYCRWQMEDGSVHVNLLCSKARIVPLLGLSTPRSELCGAVISARLAWTVIQALEQEEKPDKVLFGGDSETVLAAREKAVGALGEYFGNRIGEIWDLQGKIEEIVPIGLEGKGEWYHMPSADNCADRPSRLDSKIEDLSESSEWLKGKSYLYEEFSQWPWERKFTNRKISEAIPKKELASKYRGLVSTSKNTEENPILKLLDYGFITNEYDKLIDKTEPFFRWYSKHLSGKSPTKITLTSRDLAIRFWFRKSMGATEAAVQSGRLKELTTEKFQDMVVIRGRANAAMKEILGAEYLPVLMSAERIAVLLMLKSHEESGHKSSDITLFKSRQYAWIVGGRRLAKTVCKFCIKCRYIRKKEESQKMADLPEEVCLPCPAFTNIAIDLAGPYFVQSMAKKRGTRLGTGSFKVWAVLAVCLNTRAVKIYIAPGYSTKDFLLAWECLEAECGIPRRVHSDRGSQLISAAGEIENIEFDWDTISGHSKGQTKWSFCPAGAQWRNGSVEAFVKKFKKTLVLYRDSGLNFAELQTTFKKIACTLNSRPISARYGSRQTENDPDYLELITPNMLLTGRSGRDLPLKDYEDTSEPTRRLAHKQELERSWWERWKVQGFDSLLPSKTWTKKQRGVRKGDIVLIKYSDKSKLGTFKLGIVLEVEVDEDKVIRTCTVGYRIVRSDIPAEEMRIYLNGLKFKKIRVPVQRLCVILPIEESEEPDFTKKMNSGKVSKLSGTVSSQINDYGNYEALEDMDCIQLNDEVQLNARRLLIDQFKCSRSKRCRVHMTSSSIKLLYKSYSQYCEFTAHDEEI